MAYDEALAERVDAHIGEREGISDRKMFGGIAWMLNGNMAVGILGDELLVRVDKDRTDEVLSDPAARQADMNGRPMSGFVMVEVDEASLGAWVDRGLAYAASLPPK